MRTSRYTALLALSLVGCGFVAPLDDIDENTGTGSQGGGGGKAGAGGQAGSTVAGQGGGGAGQSGQGGTAGVGGESGAGGDAGSTTTGGNGGKAGTGGQGGSSGAGAGGDSGQGGDSGAGSGGEAGAGAGGDSGQGGDSGAGQGGSSGAGAGGEAGAGAGGEGGAGQGGSSGAGQGGSSGAGGGPVCESIGTLGGECSCPGKLACNGHAQPLKLVCENGKWTANDVCEDNKLCETEGLFAGTCRPIVKECEGKAPGDATCNGSVRTVCGVDLTTVKTEDCGTEQLCQLGSGPACGKCLTGEFQCEGVTLSKCSADNLSFEKVEDCATADLCNAGAGQCTNETCVPDQHNCAGDILQVCNAGLTDFENKETCNPGLCDFINKQCDKCVPNAATCKDVSTLQVCSEDGQTQNETTCPAEAPLCANGKCVACVTASDCPATGNECLLAVCTSGACGTAPAPGGTEISSQTKGDCQRIVCDGSGAQTSAIDDSDVPVDDNNACTSQACKSGVVEYPPVAAGTDCGGGKKCDGAGTCGECTPGEKRCSGTKVQVCVAGGKFQDESTCSGGTPYCASGACVACTQDSQCTSSDECKAAACINNACGTTNKPNGTPLAPANQVANDCKTAVCDGSGSTTTTANTGDLPTNSNECLTAACSPSGDPTFPPKAAGTSCNSGAGVCNGAGKCGVCVPGTKRCNSNTTQVCNADGQWTNQTTCSGAAPYCNAGSCVECNAAAECTAAGECRTAACTANKCVYTNKANGTATSSQTSGDCKKNVCDGNGGITTANDNADLPPDDGKVCTDQACTSGTPTFPNKPAGTNCGGTNVCDGLGSCGVCTPGEKRCNGTKVETCQAGGIWSVTTTCSGGTAQCSNGACVACTLASHCTAPNECQTAVCNPNNTCGTTNKPNGTVTAAQTPNDCKKGICDGAGNLTTTPDNADLPLDDGKECTDQACTSGTPTFPNKPAGTACSGGTKVCSGTGICGTCIPSSKRCNSATQAPEICDASGNWVANGTCSGGTPYCAAGNCVACTQASHCAVDALCETAACTNNACIKTNKPIATTCGDNHKCSFETCDESEKTDCGECNATCTGPGNNLPVTTCTGSCDAGPDNIVNSTMVTCGASVTFDKRDVPCATGWEAAPALAWTKWRDTTVPTNNYWTDDNLKYDGNGTNDCSATLIFGSDCGLNTPMRVCGASNDKFNNACNWLNCDFGTVTAGSNDYFGGCSGNTTAGAVCWRNPCADKTVEQTFPNGMAGCAGSVTFANRASLCGTGYHVCTAKEYLKRRRGEDTPLAPTHHYWTNDALKYTSGDGGGGPNDCIVDVDTGTSCGATTPMRVCKQGNGSDPSVDAENNTCNWYGCGYGAETPNEYFGGCAGNTTAGALCCSDSPCADGTVEQTFLNGMVGCAGKTGFGFREELCGPGYHVATGVEWGKYRGGIAPTHHYWIDSTLGVKGTTGNCGVGTPGGTGPVACAGKTNALVCAPKASDPLGNSCPTYNCGGCVGATCAPGADIDLGGCASTAGTLCVPD